MQTVTVLHAQAAPIASWLSVQLDSASCIVLCICQSRGSKALTSAAMAYIDRLKLLTMTKAPRR